MTYNTSIKTILILAANPKTTSRLRLDEEIREIDDGLKNSEYFRLVTKLAVRQRDFYRAILEYQPQIIHFCGHGNGDNGLVLEDEYGYKQLVSSESLAGLFKHFKNHVECVVLNACYSEVQAEAIYQHINCVVGMNYQIGDKAAIKFATGFYDALTNGRNYQDSFEFGKNALDLENIPESGIPQIKIKDISQSLLDLNSTDNSNHKSNFEPIKNIPNRGSKNFVGRQDELVNIHNKLQENNTLSISAVSGIGGVGKTELALQYAQRYDNYYPGGICWLNARDTDLAAEIIQFYQFYVDNQREIPLELGGRQLTVSEQAKWCWENWQPSEGIALVAGLTQLAHCDRR